MPVTGTDVKTGRVSLDALARQRGSLHTLTGRDPQTEPDHDTEPPVERTGER